MASTIVAQNLGDATTIQKGGGTATASPSGVLHANTTQAGTIADTNETDLWSYSMPANTLNANGKAVRVTAWGVFGATANNKTLRLYFGGTAIVSQGAGAFNALGWVMTGVIVRTGAAAQITGAIAEVSTQAVMANGNIAPAADTTAAIIIKVTGQNGTAAANDVVFRGAIVEALN